MGKGLEPVQEIKSNIHFRGPLRAGRVHGYILSEFKRNFGPPKFLDENKLIGIGLRRILE